MGDPNRPRTITTHHLGPSIGAPRHNGVRIRWNEADQALERWMGRGPPPPYVPEPLTPEPEPEAWQPWDGQAALDSETNAEEWGDVLRLVACAHFRVDAKAIVLERVCKPWRHYWRVAEKNFATDVAVARRVRDSAWCRRHFERQGLEGDALEQRMLAWCLKCEAEPFRAREARQAADRLYREAEQAKQDWMLHAFKSGRNNVAMPRFNIAKLPANALVPRQHGAMLADAEEASHSVLVGSAV